MGSLSDPVSDEQLVQQIRAMVEAELRRRGRPGRLRVEGRLLVAGTGATQARADLEGTIRQWHSLPEDLQQRRAQQIAQLLAEGAERAPIAVRKPRANRPGLFSFVAPLFVVALMLAGVALAYRYLSPNQGSALAGLERWLNRGTSPSSAPSASAPSYNASNAEYERAVIASTACAQARRRVARGALVGPADVEGWQVELVLLRRGSPLDLSQSPALAPFVRRASGDAPGKWLWSKASSLIAEERVGAQVELRALPPLGKKRVSGVSFVFSGPYVIPYFTEDQRADYFLLADALADALGATDGALFAHCTDSDAHHVGSWFLGATPGSALGSLIYFMESYSDLPVLKAEILGDGADPARRGHTFDAIDQAAAALSRSSVATLVGSELGMISGKANQPARLTFPFRDGNRASRSGLQAARSLGLASTR